MAYSKKNTYKRTFWSESESALLHNLGADFSLEEMREQLFLQLQSQRTKASVQLQCKKMHIKFRDTRKENSGRSRSVWTPERVEELRKLAPTMPLVEVAAKMGTTYGSVAAAVLAYSVDTRGKFIRTPEEIEARTAPLRGRVKVDKTVPRECSKCGALKAPEEFYTGPSSGRTCKACLAARARAYKESKVPEVKVPSTYWAALSEERKRLVVQRNRFSRYGMTLEDALMRMEAQQGLCGLCGEALPALYATDHSHDCCPAAGYSCGKCVRSFTHIKCNTALGYFEFLLKSNLLDIALKYVGCASDAS